METSSIAHLPRTSIGLAVFIQRSTSAMTSLALNAKTPPCSEVGAPGVQVLEMPPEYEPYRMVLSADSVSEPPNDIGTIRVAATSPLSEPSPFNLNGSRRTPMLPPAGCDTERFGSCEIEFSTLL